MDQEMIEQIQQMITTASQSLCQEIVGDLRQEMAGLDLKMDVLATSLRVEMAGMKTDLRQEMAGMKVGLREEIADTKRHAGILNDGIWHRWTSDLWFLAHLSA
jgi:hypothetical protein